MMQIFRKRTPINTPCCNLVRQQACAERDALRHTNQLDENAIHMRCDALSRTLEPQQRDCMPGLSGRRPSGLSLTPVKGRFQLPEVATTCSYA